MCGCVTQRSSVRLKQKSFGLGFWKYYCCPISKFFKKTTRAGMYSICAFAFFFFFSLLEDEFETGTPSFNPESTVVSGKPHNKDAGAERERCGHYWCKETSEQPRAPISELCVYKIRLYCKCLLYMQMNAVLSGWEIWPQKWINLTCCFTGNLFYEVSNVRLIWAK